MEDELIQPRAGEQVDLARLRSYLKEVLPGAAQELRIQQFSGGKANLTYLLESVSGQYVLRRPPLGPLAPHAHDMGREFRVLEGLHDAFPLAPRAIHYCPDPDVLGAPFFIMERREGVVVRAEVPGVFGGGRDAHANRRMSTALVDSLAQFHAVDYEAAGLGSLGKAAGFMKRQVRGWAQAYHRSKENDLEGMTDLIRWLKDELPDRENASLVHNDWRLDNLMLDESDPGRVVAVFDWDMCTIGEPLADLGTLLTLWIEAGEDNSSELASLMPAYVPGFLKRREAVERYAAAGGLDVSRMDYFYAFGLFKMGVIAAQIYQRFRSGVSRDQRFAVFGEGARLLYARAMDVAAGRATY